MCEGWQTGCVAVGGGLEGVLLTLLLVEAQAARKMKIVTNAIS